MKILKHLQQLHLRANNHKQCTKSNKENCWKDLKIIITNCYNKRNPPFSHTDDLSVSECFISIMLSTIMIMPIGILIIAAIEVVKTANIPNPVEITLITKLKVHSALSVNKERNYVEQSVTMHRRVHSTNTRHLLQTTVTMPSTI